MTKAKILILIASIFPAHLSAEDNVNIIDQVKKVIGTLSESRELKEKSMENYNENDITEQINRSVDNFDLSQYTEKASNFLRNNLQGFSMNVRADDIASTIRDPFNLSNQAGNNRSSGLGFGSSFLPDINNTKIPMLKVKGIIYSESRQEEDLLALLEVGKDEVHMVRVGDEISYNHMDPNAAIKIINISRLTVTVQAGRLGNILIVR